MATTTRQNYTATGAALAARSLLAHDEARRDAAMRQRLVEHMRDGFGFEHADVLFQPPAELGHVRLAARS